MNLDYRQAIKDEQFPKSGTPKPEDILSAVMNIYQFERGLMIEDDEAYNDLFATATKLFRQHDADAKDASDLVDRILADIPGTATHRDPAISGRLFN
jgi:hypothetical protein